MLSDQHKTFLQAIMHRGILSDVDAKELALKIFGDRNTIAPITETINRELQQIEMAIKNATCELTGHKYWTLISTVIDESAKFHCNNSAAELALLRKIYGEIIASPEGCIPSTTCLNFGDSMDSKISKADADIFLQRMTAEEWLCEKDGIYYMGARSIAELMPYFRTVYEQDSFNTCYLCKQVLFHGTRCEKCHASVHLYCFAFYAKMQNPEQCPKCHQHIETPDLSDISLEQMDNIDTTAAEELEISISQQRSRKRKH